MRAALELTLTAWRYQRAGTALLLAILISESCFAFMPVLAFGYIVQRGTRGFLPVSELWAFIVVVALSSVFSQVLRRLLDVLSEYLGQIVGAELDLQVAKALSEQKTLDCLDRPELRAALAGAFGPAARTTELRVAYAATFRLMLLEIQAFFSAVLLIALEPLPGLVIALCFWLVSRRTTSEYSVEQSQLYGERRVRPRADYLRDLVTSGRALKEIRVFALSSWLSQCFSRECPPMPLPPRSAGRTLSIIALGTLTACTQVFFFARVAQSNDDLGNRAGALMLATSGLAGLMGLLSLTMDLLHRREGLRRLPAIRKVFSMLDDAHCFQLTDSGGSAERQTALMEDVDGDNGKLIVDDVWYRYPDSDRWVLQGVSFEVRPGQSVGIVGVNGAGKSTLVKLLCGMLTPQKGDLLLNGVSIHRVERSRWHRYFAVVLQNFARYPMNLRENVTLGSNAPSDNDLLKIASQTGIAQLPGGDMSSNAPLLSRAFPNGVELSGGQWQRVAVARALCAIQAGAQFLVMDEPTAALDPRAESSFYDSVIDSGSCTTFLISHRFATVRRADVIMVLNNGKISEMGNHRELMERGGLYARMFCEQAAKFHIEQEL